MRILLVHGLGRTSMSMARLAVYLRRQGHRPGFFAYCAAVEPWEGIRSRLRRRLLDMQRGGPDYALVGHSLGGVLLADALVELAHRVSPRHLFTLGTPLRPPRLIGTALRFGLYRILTRESGRRLADPRTYRFAPLSCPWTSVCGTAGLRRRHWSVFNEPNDGLLAVSEAYSPSASATLFVDSFHTFIMNAASVRTRIASTLVDHR